MRIDSLSAVSVAIFNKKLWELTNIYKGINFLTNSLYGNEKIKAETDSISTMRLEIAFLFKIIKILNIGGKACIISPDGVLENPSYKNFRKEILEKYNIDSIILLPKFAFAPYTKEKTFALFITKKSEKNTAIQKKTNLDVYN